MNNSGVHESLCRAAANRSSGVEDMLPIVVQAIETGDRALHFLAADLVIGRVVTDSQADRIRWDASLSKANTQPAMQEYLSCLFKLGKLFGRADNERDRELADVVLLLMEKDASDPVLGLPYCVDVGGQPSLEVESKWESLISQDRSNVNLLSNAAEFFIIRKAEKARELFAACAQLQPDDLRWGDRIAEADSFVKNRS